MNKLFSLATTIMLLSCCSRHADHSVYPGANRTRKEQVRQTSAGAERARTVDPTSSTAAEELVEGFAALLNSGRIGDAYMLLGSNAPTRESFEANFAPLQRLQVTVHPASDQEGAAGSTYVTVPLSFSGIVNGTRVSHSGKAVLRRVNDIPGSTEAQRHWHIEQVVISR